MPASIAKISCPAAPDIVPRERLFQQLDTAMKRPVVWLSGPAGSGKTTLVSSYLESRALPSIWYQVDEGDSDVASLFYYLGLAAQGSRSAGSPPLPIFAHEHLARIAAFSRLFFERLYLPLPRPSAIVFNSYQDAGVEQGFHEAIRTGLDVLPRGITVIITSRGTPPDSMTQFQLEKRLVAIGWDDLKLTRDETAAIVSSTRGRKVSDGTIDSIHTKAHGWLAGVLLMTGCSGLTHPGHPPADPLPLNDVFSYFSGAILAKIDPATRQFLLKTSLLPRMTATAAATLTGQDTAETILSTLVVNNLFTSTFVQRSGEITYQYHPLFRDFLLSRTRIEFPPHILNQLQHDACDILIADGQAEEAGDILRKLGDWERLTDIAVAEAPALLAHGRGRTLAGWFEGAPVHVIERSPWLACFLGLGTSVSDPAESTRLLTWCFDRFEQTSDASGGYLSWLSIVISQLHGRNDAQDLDAWIDRINQLCSRIPFPDQEIEARVVIAMVVALTVRQRYRSRDAICWADHATKLAMSGSRQLKTRVLASVCFLRYWMGDLAACSVYLEELRDSVHCLTSSPVDRLAVLWMQATLLCTTGADADKCIPLIEDGLNVGNNSEVYLWNHLFLACGVFAALNWGDSATAAHYLDKFEACLDSGHAHAASMYHYLASWHDITLGKHVHALAHAEQALAEAGRTGNGIVETLAQLAIAQCACESGDHDRAEASLGMVEEHAGKSRMLTFMLLITRAQIANSSGDAGLCCEVLRKALKIGRQEGYCGMAWWWQPSAMAALCCTALDEGIEVPYVRTIITRRKLEPASPPVHLDNWPWPVRIHTLGRFSIVINETPLVFSGKIQQKPLALLKAIITLGGRNVPVETLIDLIWPDADGDDGFKSFTIALHRLRRLLGTEKAILFFDGKVALNNRCCWLDTWAFERLYGSVEQSGNDRQAADGSETIRKAIQQYSGHFLAGESAAPWVIPTRERLRLKVINLISRCGRAHEARNQWDSAAAVYMKGLDIADEVEEFHQRLMASLCQLDRPGEALAAYTRCRKVLALIGARPNEVTTSLYLALLDGQPPKQ